MLGGALTDLMKLNTLVQLLMKALFGSTIRWMKSGVITICASSPSYAAIPIRTCKACVQDNFLQAFAIFSLEISDKRVVSFPHREIVFFESVIHRVQK